MSKGLGHVQRKIDLLLNANCDRSYTVEELCRRVYDHLRFEKRHRVAVIRAAKAVVKRHPNIVTWHAERRGGTLVFFNHTSVISYATARLKAEWGESDAEAYRRLREDDRYAKMIRPGGTWWMHVEEWVAKRDNDVARLEALKPHLERLQQEQAVALATLKRMMGGAAI